MRNRKFEIFIDNERFSGEMKVYIFCNEGDGRRSLLTDLTTGEMKTHKEGTCIDTPTFRLGYGMSQPFLQAMANELHTLGIKAEKEPVLENELSSTKYHLEDMRALVFENYKHDIIINKEENKDGKE